MLFLAAASGLQLQPATLQRAALVPTRALASPRLQFGGKPDSEPKGLSRENEPEEFFSTNMGTPMAGTQTRGAQQTHNASRRHPAQQRATSQTR